MNQHSSVRLVVFLLFALIGLPALSAELLTAQGGPDGNYFRTDCPSGHFLVGLEGRHGAWLDSVAPICARWASASNRLESAKAGKAAGGGGGAPGAARCPAGLAVSGLNFWVVVEGRPQRSKHVRKPSVTCDGPLEIQARQTVAFTAPGISDFDDTRTSPIMGGGGCRAGQRAIGVHGLADVHINALGLVCGPAPKSAEAIRAVGPRPGQEPETRIGRDLPIGATGR
jgi:hypothetical protein